MMIRIGYDLVYRFPQDTAVILMLNAHFSRAADIVVPDQLKTDPEVQVRAYRDSFGNWCNRLLAPAGRIRISGHGVVKDDGLPDPVVMDAEQHPVNDLPEETLMFLLGSRYCEVDEMTTTAWNLFGGVKARLDTCTGHLRLRQQAHYVWLSQCALYPHCSAGVHGRRRRLP